MSYRRLGALLGTAAAFSILMKVAPDSDTWWHLAAGDWILDHGQLLAHDPFSLARQGAPWVYPGWLAQISMSLLFRAAGPAGLNLWTAAMGALAFALIMVRMKAGPITSAALMILGAASASIFVSARPHMYTILLSAVFIHILEVRHQHPRLLFALPIGMLLWVNLHGGFAVGFILVGVYLLGDLLGVIAARPGAQSGRARAPSNLSLKSLIPMASAGAASLVTATANPHGPRILLYPFQTVSIGVLQRFIQEWQSPDFHQSGTLPFLLLMLTTVVVLGLSRKRLEPSSAVGLAVFAYLSLTAARNIPLYSMFCLPVLARHMGPITAELRDRIPQRTPAPATVARTLNLALGAVIVVLALAWTAVKMDNEQNWEVIGETMPTRAVTVLQESEIEGPLFITYRWGGYVIWAAWPDRLSFVDGRTDLMGEDILSEYLAAWAGQPGWKETFDRWEFRAALVEPSAPIRSLLEENGWRLEYSDDVAVIVTAP